MDSLFREIFKTHREPWRSARKPGDSRVNRETWQLWFIDNEAKLDLMSSTIDKGMTGITQKIGTWRSVVLSLDFLPG